MNTVRSTSRPAPDADILARDNPDFFDLLFDPAWLGIPAGTPASGRALTPSGSFVEFFVSVVDGSIREAGFLTDCPPSASTPVMALASLWCGRARGLTPEQAARLEAEDILACGMEPLDTARAAAETCLAAARTALVRAALVQECDDGARPPGCSPECAAKRSHPGRSAGPASPRGG
ncbi:hypothetical protein NNJEOMEG_02096 [Fundidesulfovibrio magnetotacticus]|uniref:NIF system FeS cluster assembly NifU N-terminal domain-containing protein n=1 Tax=Fundidesulfovibrio magnetotacticus TaxID=2730080 RepID=A0A6V8LRB6_9BACT|nr:hypothetical protein [Fundidesulfovibrio magnetotacticus]GFK94254.1 hypothetical protein NNJEOMEG_02096 [Fundidesulfovibrio magnetotacticus]